MDLTFEYTSGNEKNMVDVPLGIDFFWPSENSGYPRRTLQHSVL